MNNKSKLKKELNLLSVYAIATGTTLSAGFFLLPGLAAAQVGSAIVISYLVAAIPLIPATFSIIELSTAMPRAGGIYYYMDRTLGPFFGTVGGLGTWLALVLKVAFALIGMGAYLSLLIPGLDILPVALGFAVTLGFLNIIGAKKTGSFQIILVTGLLLLLTLYIWGGLPEVNLSSFSGLFDPGFNSIISSAGLVYISYVGVTKVASLSEEIRHPEKNLPRGIFLALLTSIIIYFFGTVVMAGVLPVEQLSGNLTPVADSAKVIFGDIGSVLLSIAALLAFISVANAGTMSASRYPLAMSRDHLVPLIFRKLSKKNTPHISIVFTVTIIVLILIFLDPTKIAKLASAFQLLVFGFICLAVIIMRESRLNSYDPGFKSPLYPWMQIAGIIIPIFFIYEMGLVPTLFSLGLIIAATFWYFLYAKKRVTRTGAIYHVFERLGKQRYEALDSELRGILKEKGLRDEDPFDEIIMQSKVIDIKDGTTFDEVVKNASKVLASIVPQTEDEIAKQLLEGTRLGATPVTKGVALPHFRAEGIEHSELLLVRSKEGINVKLYDPISHKEIDETTVTAMFFLVSPEDKPGQHLRILAQIASRVDEESFIKEWNEAEHEVDLKESLLHDDRFYSLCVSQNSPAKKLIGLEIKDADFPEGVLVAMLRRGGEVMVPKGNTVLQDDDRLTIIGEPKGLKELKNRYE